MSVSKWLCFVPSFEIFSDTSQGTGGSLVSEASVKKYESDNLSVHESKQEQKKKVEYKPLKTKPMMKCITIFINTFFQKLI